MLKKNRILNLHIIDMDDSFSSSARLRTGAEEQFASAFNLFFESEEEVQSVEATKGDEEITINFTFRSGAMKLLVIKEEFDHHVH
jgi:hypothetical protein